MPDRFESRLDVPFAFPDVADKNVLVIGLGGGCDIITAFAVSKLLNTAAARIVYANTKTDSVGPLLAITPHIGNVNSPIPEPGCKPKGCGKAAIDHAMPRNEHGSPWIIRLADETAERELPAEIRSLGFDLLLGVDAGGDSITEHRPSRPGRDQRMLRVLRQVGVPVLHVVVAPGCDGESTADDLHSAMVARLAWGWYRGRFPLSLIADVLRAHSGGLKESRTPRIVLAAADGLLPRTSDGRLTVPRGCTPSVPAEWLAHAFVFEPTLLPAS